MGLLERMEMQRKQQNISEVKDEVKAEAVVVDKYAEIKNRIHVNLLNELGTPSGAEEMTDENAVRRKIKEQIALESDYIPRMDREKIEQELFDNIMGYGPIEPLLRDPTITEIMVNGPKRVYVEVGGKLKKTEIQFRDNAQVMNVIDRIVSTIGRRVDEASPMVDARLTDGSRVNAVIAPVSLIGPCLTIRKFSKVPFDAAKIVELGSANIKMLTFLEACVKGRMNVVVSGGTGSGKTTLLNVLSSFIPETERIVTIEDAAELQLEQEHVVTMEARPANLEGRGQITIRDLVRNALRMRPDRIIVGEVRTGEALDMLQAMNTGHDGSLTTIHANTPRDTLARLETMVLMSGMELPVKAIREQVSSAINIIVQQSRFSDGTRKITSVSEIVGMEGDVVSMHEIFRFQTDGRMDGSGKFRGRFVATGIRPKCADKIREKGIAVSDEWFNE